MGKTTNILDLNNRLTKVEKENVAQNNYNSLKNRPKINGNLLTGDKTGTQLGLAEALEVGSLSALTTTDKSSCVGAINELASGLTNNADIPSTSGILLETITAGNTSSFTVNDNGYLAIVCTSGSSQKTFSAVIRDSAVINYGTVVNATLEAYNKETIGGLFVKNGRTYSVRNISENDIDVYFCT